MNNRLRAVEYIARTKGVSMEEAERIYNKGPEYVMREFPGLRSLMQQTREQLNDNKNFNPMND